MFDFVNGSLTLSITPFTWVELGVSLILFLMVLFLFLKTIRKRIYSIIFIGLYALVEVSWLFKLQFLSTLLIAIAAGYVVVVLVYYQGEIRNILVNFTRLNAHKNNSEKVFDRHDLYQKIGIAVETLSKTRTGAIITFERNNDFSDYVKTGTILNAPVTPELLLTIFYPGTRLHDGAVVIRRDFILAASVYYTPTTKPLTGKFGSRHRAAIGISEITDSVTVVVSEETGRISLAIGGELIHVSADNFIRTFEDHMFNEDELDKKE